MLGQVKAKALSAMPDHIQPEALDLLSYHSALHVRLSALLTAPLPMAVSLRSSHLEAFYRQLHIAYFEYAFQSSRARLYISLSNLYRASAIKTPHKSESIIFKRHSASLANRLIQLLQAARAEPLIVVCNGQRVLFRVRLPTYGTVHGCAFLALCSARSVSNCSMVIGAIILAISALDNVGGGLRTFGLSRHTSHIPLPGLCKRGEGQSTHAPHNSFPHSRQE